MWCGKLNRVFLADPVQDMPHRRFQCLKRSVSFGAQPLIFTLTPQGFDFVEVGTISGQVQDIKVLLLPDGQAGGEGSGMVEFGVVEHEHRRPGTGSRPGIERVDDKGGIQATLSGGGMQLIGGGVEEAQYVESLTMTRLGSDVLAAKLPAVGDG